MLFRGSLNNPGPDNAKLIRAAVAARLKQNLVLSPERYEDILRAAERTIPVRIDRGTWRVTERDLEKFLRHAESLPGWRHDGQEQTTATKRESPMDKLKRANREARRLKENPDGSFSPAN